MGPTNITFPKVVNFDVEDRTYNVYQSGYVEIFTEIEGYISFSYARDDRYNKISRIGLDLIGDKFKGELK